MAAFIAGVRCTDRILTSVVTSVWRQLPLISGSVCSFHTTPVCDKKRPDPMRAPKKWPKYNEIVYPPTPEGEPKRPAEICHMKNKIKYSKDKLWFLALMIRGISIEEAIKQMTFHKRKGGQIIKEALLEAQELAVKEHNVEYRNNLWVANSHCGKAYVVKGLRKHARSRFGVVHYTYCHYFVRLREGSPPEHYLPPKPTGYEKMDGYLEDLRKRTITTAL